MNSDDYRHFVAIVAGDNPESLMLPYDSMKEVEPYVVYKYADAESIKDKYLKMYEAILKSGELNAEEQKEVQAEYDDLKGTSAIEFFYEVTDQMEYNDDGDAISRKNKLGKWKNFQLGKQFSVPFITNEGQETYQAKKSDINWSLVHLNGQEVYARAWEMVMEHSKPENDTEKLIYENMKNRTTYFEKFGTKENYVASSTAFWGYAFLSKKTGWVELEDTENQFDWVTNYFDRFIKPLPEDTLLTIFECVK